ncbi:hypothetical protein DPMN_083496 [Dreissena polymorpha]|uniref:Uncharacterized protein n=1 Tax=Dreissena polymorpha TaxID=45954 RepID=A0A9D3YCY8_DREPO|nr:hypothetical protein DPMN_083496 [Dreissena polymorpha]
MSKHWPMAYYNKYGRPERTYYDTGYYDGYIPPYPYSLAYDVPGLRYSRSLYGRGAMSEYGYRSPYTYRSELFGSRYASYPTEDECDLYYPRFSRYRYWY